MTPKEPTVQPQESTRVTKKEDINNRRKALTARAAPCRSDRVLRDDGGGLPVGGSGGSDRPAPGAAHLSLHQQHLLLLLLLRPGIQHLPVLQAALRRRVSPAEKTDFIYFHSSWFCVNVCIRLRQDDGKH